MDLQKIKRKEFRINVKGNAAFALKINNVPYELIDISSSGLGIKLTAEDIFFNVKDEMQFEIAVENQIFKLKGKIVHINPIGPEDFKCGIQLDDYDQDTKTKWINFLKAYREKIFNEK
jgi:PilZ domain